MIFFRALRNLLRALFSTPEVPELIRFGPEPALARRGFRNRRTRHVVVNPVPRGWLNGKIYEIYFTSGGRVYIGSTIRRVEVRYYEHLELLRTRTHWNIFLQYEYNQRGEVNMRIRTLKEVPGTLRTIRSEEGRLIRSYSPDKVCNIDRYPERDPNLPRS